MGGIGAVTNPAGSSSGGGGNSTIIAPLGQQNMAASVAVVLASDQTAINVASHAVTNTGTFAVQAAQSGTWNITNVSGTISLPTGAATSAKQDTGNTSLASIDGKITAVNTGAVVLAAGSAVIGHVILDTTSTTAVTQATASSLNATVVGTGTFAVQATLAAETTKVIGVTRTADGAGNLLTSNSTTYTAKFGLDANLLGTLGTAFSTAGKVDVKAADGDVFVRQTTAANLNATVVQATGTNLHTVVDSGTITTVSTVTSLSQFAGTAIDVNSGNKGNGTLRVVLATDQPQLTAKLLVTPDANSAVNVAQMNGVAVSMGVGATGTGVQRSVLANDAGKTLVSKGGSASSSGDNTLVTAGTNRLKVYAFSLSTVSTTAVTCIFQSGASGTELWRVVLQTPASVAGGANLVVQPPAWLFATASATLLNLNLSAAVTVHWSVSYYDEA